MTYRANYIDRGARRWPQVAASGRKASLRAKSGRTYPAQPLTDAEVRRLIEAIGGNGPIAVRNGQINVRRGKGSKQRAAYYDDAAVPYLKH